MSIHSTHPPVRISVAARKPKHQHFSWADALPFQDSFIDAMPQWGGGGHTLTEVKPRDSTLEGSGEKKKAMQCNAGSQESMPCHEYTLSRHRFLFLICFPRHNICVASLSSLVALLAPLLIATLLSLLLLWLLLFLRLLWAATRLPGSRLLLLFVHAVNQRLGHGMRLLHVTQVVERRCQVGAAHLHLGYGTLRNADDPAQPTHHRTIPIRRGGARLITAASGGGILTDIEHDGLLGVGEDDVAAVVVGHQLANQLTVIRQANADQTVEQRPQQLGTRQLSLELPELIILVDRGMAAGQLLLGGIAVALRLSFWPPAAAVISSFCCSIGECAALGDDFLHEGVYLLLCGISFGLHPIVAGLRR
mmetsp:Transcript_13272/g.38289  ORF Transcript_13272/g.38289 Transcript_13272/m.38289 type:complete len:363 (+) Transcript_13272:1587-2675(+)